ncbi:MAG: MFS transporter [Chloroflexota bacterium]
MTTVALPVQVYALTHSTFAVGIVGVAIAAPLLTLGLIGGSIADAADRRKLGLLTISFLSLVSLALAVQALLNLRWLALLYALAALQSSLVAFDSPTRRAYIPRLLPPERLAAAAALAFLSFHVSMIAGPLLAGVIIATWNLQVAYLVDAVSFIFSIYSVYRLPPMRVREEVARPGVRSVVEGLRFIRGQRILTMALLVDLDATVFGMPHALFPALALTHFGGGVRTVGLLYAAPAVGGFLAAALSGPLSHVRRQGLAIELAVGVWGISIAAFGFMPLLTFALVFLAVAGAADVVNGVFRSTLLQVNTPDSLHGRVSSVGYMVGAGGPRLGDVEAGVVAAFTSPGISAISGGLACVAGLGVLSLLFPGFARYDARAATRSRDH